MNKYSGSKFVVVISIILLAAVWVIPALSDAPPSGDVMILEGNLKIDGDTASSGTVITAKAGDEVLGTVEVNEGGTFGDKPWNKLYIKEPSGTDKSVTLYAKSPDMTDSIKIVESITWSEGIYQIDINAVTTSTNDNSGNAGSISSGRYTIVPLGDDEGASAGGAGIDTTPVSAQETTSSQEAGPVSDGDASGKGSSSTTVIIAFIAILAIGGFLIYQKVK